MHNNPQHSQRCIVVITGPTGVGKSDVALALAQRHGAEIVNADMGQCYVPLSIGTAKPDWRAMPVPHHLFDIVEQPQHLAAGQYRQRVVTTVHAIWQRDRLPIIVGGSGFYVKSLFFPPRAGLEPHRDVVIKSTETSAAGLWQQLYDIDPARAGLIGKNDTYRIQRALAIWESTGTLPSQYAPIFEPPASFHCWVLMRDRDDLYRRIDQRVIAMLERGWCQEVEQLRGTAWEPFIRLKKFIGYDVILDHLNGDISRDLMTISIQQKTRNYAKRQMTFLKSFSTAVSRALVQHQQPLFHGSINFHNLSNMSIEAAVSDMILH